MKAVVILANLFVIAVVALAVYVAGFFEPAIVFAFGIGWICCGISIRVLYGFWPFEEDSID